MLDADHMVALYQAADVVADEFGVGWFGYVTLEGLACGRPALLGWLAPARGGFLRGG